LAVTVGLFILVFQKLEAGVLWETFSRVKPLWFLLAIILYGVALGLGGLRWHLALRLTECTVHVGASCRLLLIGHFFFVVLFGAAGGDVAKSVLYARRFRYGVPEVVASAPLDRSLGTLAAFLVVGMAFLLAFSTGGFHEFQPVEWNFLQSWWMLLVGAAVLLGMVFLIWRPREESPWIRGWRAFWAGVDRFFKMPVLGRKALAISIVHQVLTHAVFAMSLAAVSEQPLPWLELSWTIPAINILSCFPITFAGAGVREVASVTFLGMYGLPAGDAVAAAMLTLVVKLWWAGVGGLVFWREEAWQARRGGAPNPKSLSVVIPTLNEEKNIPELVPRLQSMQEVCEVIVVDGGSHDCTVAVAEQLGCRVLRGPRSRGGQLRLGASQAVGDVVWLVHADTQLPASAGTALLNCLRDASVVAGGFWKMFEDTPWILLGSRFKCAVRLWIWRRLAGDQAIFVRRDVLESVGGIPDVPLMEEFELCRRLRKVGRLALAGDTLRTSARRFRDFGVWRTYLRMGRIHALYRMGRPLEELRNLYGEHGDPPPADPARTMVPHATAKEEPGADSQPMRKPPSG
jgi:rSAM/selenodomain-associated transferase 2